MSTLIEAIVKAVKETLPTEEQLLEFEFTERPVVFLSPECEPDKGFYSELNFKFKIGSIPVNSQETK